MSRCFNMKALSSRRAASNFAAFAEGGAADIVLRERRV